MKRNLRYNLVIACFLLAHLVQGQKLDLTFHQFTVEHGLPSNHIHDIDQDDEGFLWIASRNGLSRFDGQHFKTYHSDHFGYGLSSNVTAVCVIDKDIIWLVIDRTTLLSFSLTTQKFHNVFSSYSQEIQGLKENINRLKSVDHKTYAIGDNLIIFDQDTIVTVIKNYTAIHDLEVLSDSSFLLAGFDLCRYTVHHTEDIGTTPIQKLKKTICLTQQLPSNDLLRDSYGHLWSAPWEGSLHRIKDSLQVQRIQLTSSKNHATTEVNTLGEDSLGNIWIGTNNNGLFRYDQDGGMHQIVSESSPTQGSYISKIFCDEGGRLWVGTKSNGLFLMDPRMNLAEVFTLDDTEVLAIHKLDNRQYLIGTSHGLWSFDTASGFLPINSSIHEIDDFKVFCIYENYKGEILLGTDIALLQYDRKKLSIQAYHTIPNELEYKAMDLSRLNNTRILHLQDYILNRDQPYKLDAFNNRFYEPRLDHNEYQAHRGKVTSPKRSSHIHDCSDTVLIGALYGYGIFYLDYTSGYFNHGAINSTYNNRVNVIETNRVNKTYVDSLNSLWGLTEYNGAWLSKGLVLNDSNHHHTETPEQLDYIPFLGKPYCHNSLNGDLYRSDDFVDMIQVGPNKYFIITLEGELLELRQDKSQICKLYEHDGQLHQFLSKVGSKMYIKDHHGIVCFDLATGLVQKMGKADGIRFCGSAGLVEKDGTVLLGGDGGLCKVSIDQMDRGRGKQTDIYCNAIRIMGQDWEWTRGEPLSLTYNNNYIEADLGHLSLSQESFNYEYRIPQLHNNWIQTSDKLSYHDLKPGKYDIEVRLVTDTTSKPVKVLKLSISPPWWRTWWFIGIGGLGLIGLAYTIYRHQINEEKRRGAIRLNTEIKAQEAERKRLSTELHDDFGMRMSALRMYVDAIKQKTTDSNEEVKQLSGKAAHLIDGSMQDLRNLLNNLSPTSLTMNGLIPAISTIISGINSLNEIQINFSHNYLEGSLSKDIELNIFRIIQELLNNSIKHSECSQIHLEICHADQSVDINYYDNGTGFDHKAKTSGYGLANIDTRVRSSNGKYTIDTHKGFRFNLKLPIDA